MTDYFDKNGTPISMREFAEKKEDKSYSRIDWTDLEDEEGAFVSTVWLGLNHRFFEPGEPLIFETMAFYDDDWQECRRYATEEEAKKGHKLLVAEILARRFVTPVESLRRMDVEED